MCFFCIFKFLILPAWITTATQSERVQVLLQKDVSLTRGSLGQTAQVSQMRGNLLDGNKQVDDERSVHVQSRPQVVQDASFDRPRISKPISTLEALMMLPRKIYNNIAVDATYTNSYEQIITFPERRPRVFNVMVATAKTFMADLVVQLSNTAKSKPFDWKRNAAFSCFGFVYVGCIQWVWYVSVFTWLFPSAITFANEPWEIKTHDTDGQRELLAQVFVDCFVIVAFVYFPVFYCIKELVQKQTNDGFRSCVEAVHAALQKYRKNMFEDIPRFWAVWVPADFLVYSAPMYMRLPLIHFVGIGWMMMLSLTRGDEPSSAPKAS